MRETLRNARTENKMTQQAVADHLGISGISYKMRYGGNLIVCSNGDIYKRRNNGFYYLTSNKIPKSSRYLYISVKDGAEVKYLLVHRIIAETFLPNRQNLQVVNHIDGNRENNSVDNLEWCNQSDNIQHMVNMHRQKYLTNMKKQRIERKIPHTRLPRKIGMKIGAYRDIENAIRPPTEEEKTKLEEYFGDSIENLLMKAKENAI